MGVNHSLQSMSGYPPMNPYMNNNMYMQPSPQQAPPQQAPKQPQPQQQQQQPPQQQQQQQQQQQRPSNDSSYWQPSYPAEPKVDQAQLEKNTLDELKAELEETDALQPTINEAAIEQLAKKVSELNTGDDAVIGSKPSSDEQQPRRRYDNNNNNSNYRNRNNRFNNNNSNSNNFGDRQYSNNKNKAEFSIPNSEFDFEASNAKFDKSEVVKKDGEEVNDEEAEEIEIPQPDEFYDKTSSFFDNISCESKERNEQRQQKWVVSRACLMAKTNRSFSCSEPRRSHFHEERKLNLETFGQATVDQSRYRNNYRGRGGYRGGRGGNNYYRNNNRNNNTYNNNNSNGYRQNNKGQDQQDAL